MSSLSPVIQGLLVSLVPEYEISHDAIGYICELSELVLLQLGNESVRLLEGSSSIVSANEVVAAIKKLFTMEWASIIIEEGLAHLDSIQNEEKDNAIKQEISDFEIIEDEAATKTEQGKGKKNIFLSANFINSFLSASIPAQLGSDACMVLSSCTENVLSTLIQQSCVTLQTTHGGEMEITKQALTETVQKNDDLLKLSNYVHEHSAETLSVPEPMQGRESREIANSSGIEPVEMDDSDEELIEDAVEEKPDLEQLAVEVEQPKVEEVVPTEEIERPEEEDFLGNLEEAIEPQEEPQEQSREITELTAEKVESIEDEGQDREVPQEPHRSPEIESEIALESSATVEQRAKDVIRVRKPVFALYGRCCPYFETTSFAVQMLSSIMEYFLRSLLVESSRIARNSRTHLQKVHARAALRGMTESQNVILSALSNAEGNNIFKDILPQLTECVYYGLEVAPQVIDKEAGFESYVSEIILYVATHLLLVASAHARMNSSWRITSANISYASLQFVSSSSPVYKFIKKLESDNSIIVDEGETLQPPPAPRIRAAEMIYLTSIIKETPLQLDNQLLIVLLFLVSLSIHTLCCVR